MAKSFLLHFSLPCFDSAGIPNLICPVSGVQSNIHRYMSLFKHLGIYHSCLYDGDGNSEFHAIVNTFVQSQKNDFTKSIDHFEKDIEHFLSIPECPNQKPLNLFWHYMTGKIDRNRMDQFRQKVDALIA
jgi:hypothetical protein